MKVKFETLYVLFTIIAIIVLLVINFKLSLDNEEIKKRYNQAQFEKMMLIKENNTLRGK